jgi:hypothetical protein
MASLRKKYQQTPEGPRRDEPPVTSPPEGTAAKLPPLAADAGKPPEMPATSESPADIAAKTTLRQRLEEMNRAEELSRDVMQQQHPPQAAEPQPQQQQMPAMPAHVEKWLAEHPQYMDPNDQIAQAEIYTATLKANRDGKTWDQPDFLPTLERHLGLAPAANGNGQGRPQPQPRSQPQPQPQP